MYHDDEEVDLDEFEGVEAEIEEDELNHKVKKKSQKECLHGQMNSKVDHQSLKVKNWQKSDKVQVSANNSGVRLAKETDEEAAERAKDKEERQRLKDEFDIYTQSIWPVIICDMKEDPKLVEKALPSQEMERQFSLLREITLKPVSALPDGYGLRVRDLKEKVEESVMEADESLSVLKDDMNKAAKKFNEQQSELEEYVKKLQKELQEKLENKQGMIKEAQDEYESAKASVETVEAAKAASKHFGSLLANTEICLKEMKEAFPELERLYERPDENVSKQRKTPSDIMMKMRERKREDAASSAAGTPDIKRKHETLKNYEEKQELLKKKLEEARASVGQQRPNEPEGEPKKKEADKFKRDLSQVKPEWLIEKKARRSDETWSEAGSERSGRPHKATQCKQMREDARVAGASQLPDGDGRCWYASEVTQYEEDERKKKEEAAKKTPNPAWGKEKMISKSGLKDPEASAQVEVKDSDDDEKVKEKEKQEAAGSSRDPPKKDKKEKKEDKKKKEKKRRASDSSEVIEASAKRRKEKRKEKTSDLE
eukprot:s4869_g8.t1